MNFTIALLQISPAGSDQSSNLAIGLDACRRAKALGADLALFPELWNIGGALPLHDRQRWIDSAIDQHGDFVQSFAALARELDLNIGVTYLEKHQPLPRNSVSFINRKGDAILHYSKVFICNFGSDELLQPNANEQNVGCDVNCSPGDSFKVCTLQGAEGVVRLGAMICSDREFPEPATQLMLNGAELIAIPNACTWDQIRTAGLKTRAFENLVGVAMVNYPSPLSNGNSQVHTCVPWQNGECIDTSIAKAGEKEEILIAGFDMGAIRAFRKAESWRLQYRRSSAKLTS
jgi:predicted amidohydrolase